MEQFEPYDNFADGLGWDERPLPNPKPKLVPPLPENIVYLEDYRREDGSPEAA